MSKKNKINIPRMILFIVASLEPEAHLINLKFSNENEEKFRSYFSAWAPRLTK